MVWEIPGVWGANTIQWLGGSDLERLGYSYSLLNIMKWGAIWSYQEFPDQNRQCMIGLVLLGKFTGNQSYFPIKYGTFL